MRTTPLTKGDSPVHLQSDATIESRLEFSASPWIESVEHVRDHLDAEESGLSERLLGKTIDRKAPMVRDP